MNTHVVVTINRQFGAEGHEIAKVLSDRLNMKLYDKDILGKAALEMGAEKNFFGDVDEKLSSKFLGSYIHLDMNFMNKSDRIFKIEEQLIRDAASSESCVIVGRLSDYLLRKEPNVITVLIHASLKFRIQNIMTKYSMSETAAKKMVRRMDMARRDYYSYYSNGKWKQNKEKDISINREKMGINGCADILETAIIVKKKQLEIMNQNC